MADPTNKQVVLEEDLAELIRQGLAITGQDTSRGSIHVDRHALRSSSSSTNYSSGSSAPTQQASTDFATIPRYFKSRDAYCYLGLTENAADLCWQTWIDSPPGSRDFEGGPTTFLHIAKAYVRSAAPDVYHKDADWRGAMRRYNLAEELIDAIMDPSFEEIRMRESCKYWVLDSFELRFRSLAELAEKSSKRKHERQQHQQSGPSSSSGLKGKSSTVVGKGKSGEASKAPIPTTGITAVIPAKLPGHIQLWKGLDRQRTTGLLDQQGNIKDLVRIISRPPGDFNATSGGYYFATDKEVADAYAAFARARSPNSDVVLLSIQIPHEFIDSLKIAYLWYSESDRSWAEYVWHCRTQVGVGLPQHLEHLEEDDLIVGHIAGTSNEQIAQLLSPAGITRQHLLSRPRSGGAGTQYYFNGRARTARQLADACRTTLTMCEASGQ